MKSKLQKARVLLRASERIRYADRTVGELSNKLRVHESYLKVMERLITPSHGLDCCDDGLVKDLEWQAIELEKEFHEESNLNGSMDSKSELTSTETNR